MIDKNRNNKIIEMYIYQKGLCHYCNRNLIDYPIHIEHKHCDEKICKTKGLNDDVVLSCYRCNGKKGCIKYKDFKHFIDIFIRLCLFKHGNIATETLDKEYKGFIKKWRQINSTYH